MDGRNEIIIQKIITQILGRNTCAQWGFSAAEINRIYNRKFNDRANGYPAPNVWLAQGLRYNFMQMLAWLAYSLGQKGFTLKVSLDLNELSAYAQTKANRKASITWVDFVDSQHIWGRITPERFWQVRKRWPAWEVIAYFAANPELLTNSYRRPVIIPGLLVNNDFMVIMYKVGKEIWVSRYLPTSDDACADVAIFALA